MQEKAEASSDILTAQVLVVILKEVRCLFLFKAMASVVMGIKGHTRQLFAWLKTIMGT